MPTFPKLDKPVVVSDAFVAPAVLDLAQGRAAVQAAVTDGFLKPFDIERADVEPAMLLYVPFWRVDVSVDGFHIGIGSMSTSSGKSIPIPTGGARHRHGEVMVCARTIVPYELRLPSWFRVGSASALEVGVNEIVPLDRAREALEAGEVVDADVTRDQGERTATGLLVRAVSPTNAIYQKYDPQIRSTTFVLYPLYYARYRYEGEARRHAGEQFFILVSGRTGAVVNAKHPSAVRAVAAKVRRFLSFDRR
jgi:hypothetical protein